MTRRTRPALNPITSHSVITTKARLCGWALAAGPAGGDGTTELTLTRDDWKIVVAFQGGTAFAAAIQYPGQSEPATILSLALMARYLRGHREQMSAFRRGQRIIVGEKAGVVEDIVPDDETKVRLVVRYDDGAGGDPFATHARAEDEMAR